MLRRCDHVIRDRVPREEPLQEVPLALLCHRRGAPDQEREVAAVDGGARNQDPLPPPPHGNPAAEQPARAVGAAQLPAPGRVLRRKRVRRVLRVLGEGRRGDGQAAPDPAALPPPPPQGRRREGAAGEAGDQHVRADEHDAEEALREPPQEGRRRYQRQGRQPIAAAEHRDAAAQVLQPPLPLRGPGARPAFRRGGAPGGELIQATRARQAPREGRGGGAPCADFLPDDPRPRHPRRLLLVPQPQVLPHRRRDLGGDS
mmetsp:Transcript_9542/g.23285  ORF Transcript_9542/g.23285 Transcript_9542/m.23285 type:complete len:258 (-) Transcript_9542:1697-2470(-)